MNRRCYRCGWVTDTLSSAARTSGGWTRVCRTCERNDALLGRDECGECLEHGHQAADMAAEFAGTEHGRRADALLAAIVRRPR